MENHEGTCTVKDLARLLRLSEKTVRNKINEGIIPTCSRISRDIRIARETVEDILSGRLPLRNGRLSREIPQTPPVAGMGNPSPGVESPGIAPQRGRGGKRRAKKQPPAPPTQ